MKNFAITALSLSILAGCGGGESVQDIADNTTTIQPPARVIFDPANSVLSVPNDLLFTGSLDGTLELPGEAAARAVNQLPDYSNPETAIGILDGWSTQHPFQVELFFPPSFSLDQATAAAPNAIRLFEVIMGGDLSDAECSQVPRGIACKPVAELNFGQHFITRGLGNNLAVIPIQPLKADTNYLVALTNSISDNQGRPLQPSTSYELLRQDLATLPLATDSQKQLQAVINSFENLLDAGFGVNKSDLVYTAAFTTQSITNALTTVKQLAAASVASVPPVVQVANTSLSVADILVAGGFFDSADPNLAPFTAAQLFAGTINLPYYLGTPNIENPLAPLNTSWQAACDGAAIVSGFAAQTGDVYPYDPATTTPLSPNDGFCLVASNGQLRDFGLDQERHITKFNSIPKTDSMQSLDVQMTVPNETIVNGIRQQLGLPALAKPGSGWPVVMLVHGITSRKEDMLSTTGVLNLFGFATVAIDLPLHGSRGFDLDMDSTDEINATTVSATHFMNLANLPVTRDNSRQAVADLLGLRLGLNFLQGADIDASQVHVLGLSLGGIVSTSFISLSNTKDLEPALGVPGIDSLFHINTAVLASPGGGLASLLVDSPSFAPLIQGSLLTAAGGAVSDEFNQFFSVTADQCSPFAQQTEAFLVCQTQAFLQQLAENNEVEKLAEVSSIIGNFAFVAQSVVDASDPSNYAPLAVANGIPILLMEVIGNGADNLPDQVIPNQSTITPIGGTEPLIRALQLSSIGSSMQSDDPISGVIRFTRGHHASIIDPSPRPGADNAEVNGRVTAQMQSIAASFFASQARAVVIPENDFIAPAN